MRRPRNKFCPVGFVGHLSASDGQEFWDPVAWIAVEELSQLSIVRDELKKIQRKVYTAEQPTERPKIETLYREMDKLARQMTETRRENRDRSEIVNEITRLSFLADSLFKSKNSQ